MVGGGSESGGKQPINSSFTEVSDTSFLLLSALFFFLLGLFASKSFNI